MILSFIPLQVFAISGDSYSHSLSIGNGLQYTYNSQDFQGNDRIQSFSFEYSPNSDVVPIVEYGNKLYGKSNIDSAVKFASSKGYNVLGAINSDYFNMATGIPTGIVIRNGELISSDGQWNGVSFSADGRATAGSPQMSMSMTNAITGDVYPIYALNKDRTGNGIHLFNGNYSADTHTTLGGTVVILEKQNPEPLKIGKQESFTVKSVEWTNQSVYLTDIQYALTYNDSYKGSSDLSILKPGDTLTLNISASKPFEEAVFATGGGDMLATNGAISSNIVSTALAPRTILGVKPDGSFKVYAIDGRQNHTSIGMSLTDCAKLLINDGYTDVINLDGGGSTSISVRLPGDTSPYVINSPSEGSLRNCATYIMFVNKLPPEHKSSAQVYPINPVVLTNSKTKVYALAYDDFFNGYGEVNSSFTSNFGNIENGVYTAPGTFAEDTISGNSENLKMHNTTFTVISSPDKLFMTRKGKVVSGALTFSTEEKADFNALSYYKSRKVLGDDTAYSWTISGNCGTIDNMGNFTASSVAGTTGILTLNAGTASISFNIKVGSEPYEIDNFELPFELPMVSVPENTSKAYSTSSNEYARFGKQALCIEMEKTESSSLPLSLQIKNGTKTISFWHKLTGTGELTLNFTLKDNSILSQPISAAKTWSFQSFKLPENIASISIGVKDGNGKLYIDSIFGYFDNGITDNEAPLIEHTLLENNKHSFLVTDTGSFPIQGISVFIDGKKTESSVISSSQAVIDIPADLRPHRVSVIATDFFGNKSKMSLDITPESYEIIFKDMEKSWAKQSVSVLYANGIFSDADNFNPSDKATTSMVATMISRYMGIDTTLYESTQLPYKDSELIPQWALPHVKALYALGIMKGSMTDKGNVFNPSDNITRAQVMTILGRTIERGYIYDSSSIGFADEKDIPSWAFDNIALLKSLGIVTGYGGDNFVKPLESIQRSEIAALLYKLY